MSSCLRYFLYCSGLPFLLQVVGRSPHPVLGHPVGPRHFAPLASFWRLMGDRRDGRSRSGIETVPAAFGAHPLGQLGQLSDLLRNVFRDEGVATKDDVGNLRTEFAEHQEATKATLAEQKDRISRMETMPITIEEEVAANRGGGRGTGGTAG